MKQKHLEVTNETGRLGEEIAQKYLTNHGFEILSLNTLEKWGEIDIIAQKGNILHFVEVKSTTGAVSHETEYRLEERIGKSKRLKIMRVIESYVAGRYSDEPEWVFDIVSVYIDTKKRVGKVIFHEDFILS